MLGSIGGTAIEVDAMPKRTGYAHGVPCWVDLSTTDVEAAKRFYGAVFGWEAEDMPTDQGMPYTMLTKNGKTVAGLGAISPEQTAAGVPPVWSTYLNVDDVDDTIAKVTEAGGTVVMPAMDRCRRSGHHKRQSCARITPRNARQLSGASARDERLR